MLINVWQFKNINVYNIIKDYKLHLKTISFNFFSPTVNNTALDYKGVCVLDIMKMFCNIFYTNHYFEQNVELTSRWKEGLSLLLLDLLGSVSVLVVSSTSVGVPTTSAAAGVPWPPAVPLLLFILDVLKGKKYSH